MPTARSMSTAWAGASRRGTLPWPINTSAIWRPTVRIGLSAVRGFWNIIAISRPRTSASWLGFGEGRSSPPSIARAAVTLPAGSRMPITAYAVTDLPDPDSPTSAMVSPLSTAKLTLSSARTMPERVRNSTLSPSTLSAGAAVVMSVSCPAPGIDQVAQAVAEQVEAEHCDHQRQAGEERVPPFPRHHEGRALRHHDAPFRRRRTHAEPDERQAGGIEDGVAHGQRHLHDQDRGHVRQDLEGEDTPVGIAA